MKDRQVESTPAPLRIPFVSAFLHCVSMSFIVFLRSGFGFAYLRPRSVFFAFSWAFALFTFYAWHERTVWSDTWLLCIFGILASILYLGHLALAFFGELYGKGKHDNDSGTPHLLRLYRLLGKEPSENLAMNWQIWGESLLALVIGFTLRWPFGEKYLSLWLMFVAPCLCAKECLNFWSIVRHKKRHKDSMEDAQDTFEHNIANSADSIPVAARKDKVRRVRKSAS